MYIVRDSRSGCSNDFKCIYTRNSECILFDTLCRYTMKHTKMFNNVCQMFWLLLSYAVAINSREIKVLPKDCSNVRFQNCTRLTEALQEIESDTTLILISGDEHVLEQHVLVHDLWNITLVSGSKQSDVTITCSEGVGLAFINITNLTLQQLTIQGCGLSGGSLHNATVAVNDIVDMFFQVPTSLHIAVLLGSISDAHLINVTVRDMVGLGLLGINLVGSSSMEGVTFANNTFENCTFGLSRTVLQNYQYQIGGGVFLAYFDYHDSLTKESRATELTVHESNFLDNHDCSTTGVFARRMQFSNTLCNEGYTVGAGGGLSVMITQKNFSVNVSVMSCFFRGNLAKYGSGAHVSHFVNSKHSKILFYRCTFIGNGGIRFTNGAGMAVFSNVLRPFDCNNSEGYFLNSIDVEITESVFNNNVAFSGGGIYSLFVHSFADNINSESVKLVYSNCTFENNTAVFGSAIFAYEHNIVTASSQTKPPGGLVVVSNISARYNTILDQIRSSRNSSGIIDVRYIHLVLSGTSTLAYNSGTALRARRSQVNVSGRANFDHNVGNFGGAISLVAYSFLVIHNNTIVIFKNNHASYRGGVFYVDLEYEPDFIQQDCFLYLDTSDQFCSDSDGCVDISRLGITITFAGNTAVSGSIVYGSALQTCAWGEGLRNASDSSENLFSILAKNEQTHTIFEFDSGPMDVRSVTTRSANLEMDNSETEFAYMPGQQFNITLTATDRLGQQIAVSVSSTVLPPDPTDNQNYSAISTVGNSNFWALRVNGSSSVPVKVQGAQHQQIRMAVFTTDSSAANQKITVNLTECVPGYNYLQEELSCVCIPEFEEHGISCSPQAYLTIPSSVWVGLFALDNGSRSNAIAVHSCIFDYCKLGEKVIAAGDFDAQCAEGYNRGGVLCGSCSEGYSIVFGNSRRCLLCVNNSTLALILAFIVAGVLLVAMVAFLKVDLSSGYINGLLFYSHILGPFIFRLAPTAPAIFLPVAFLNLDLGIETCFYNGMNALAYAGLQFVFPFYLYLLMGIIVIMARYIKCPCRETVSTGKTFATLLILSYTKILRICIIVLHYVKVDAVTCTRSSIRWATDPSVHYFSGWHVALAVLSILLLITYLIPLPLILLFPSKAYSFKYTRKMKPILDAFFAPFRPKFRCWLGIRLLTAIMLSITSIFLSSHSVCLTAIVITVLVFVQTLLKPYRGFCRNASDSFLLANMIVLFIGILFLNEQSSYIQERCTIFSAAVVSVAYIVFLGVLLYQIFHRLPLSAQTTITEKLERNTFSKALVQLYQELTASESEVVHDHELDVYIQFSDREEDDGTEESTFGKGVSVVGAPQDSEGSAEMNYASS